MTGDYTFLLAVARRPHLVPLAVRAAARSGIPRPAHRGRRRRAPGCRGAARRAGPRCATPSPTSPGSARSSRCSGVTATFAGGALADYMPALRVVGGVILVVMGLSLAGLLRDRRSSSARGGRSTPAPPPSVTTMTGGMTLAPVGRRDRAARVGSRLVGGKAGLGTVVRARRDLRHRLDAVHRRDPRRHPDDGRGRRRPSCQGALLLVGYTLGLGDPVHRDRRCSTTGRRR